MRTDDLVTHLATDLPPVRRLPAPWIQALGWLVVALCVAALPALYVGDARGWRLRIHGLFEVMNTLASLATAIAALLAAAHLARPDRSARWALVPLLPLLAWLATLGAGCAVDGLTLETKRVPWRFDLICMASIMAVGLPTAAALFRLLRHAGPVRPVPVQLYGGLAAAMLASALMSLVHGAETAPVVLVFHGLGILAVLGFSWLGGRRLMHRPAMVWGARQAKAAAAGG